ncbi:MAG: hypothetical protein VZR09_00680 [Candidatus Gastranaerophilaceae bacterium]|nr:hypothetical protein [Candidatus Gastranaerophilaceae bacterium]
MGMAASQARFLGLTARQNNVEFEGQQVNQQRTLLSNESANYYNDLLGMTVPTPPSVDAYTKTMYTFNDGALTNTVTSMIAQSNGMYTVSYLSKWQDDYSVVSAASSVATQLTPKPDDTYAIGAAALRALGQLPMGSTTQVGNTITLVDGTYSVKQDDQGYYVEKTKKSDTPTMEACTAADIANFEYYYTPDMNNFTNMQQVFKNADGTFSDADGNATSFTEDDLIICLYDGSQTDPTYAISLVQKNDAGNGYEKQVYKDITEKQYLSDDEIASITTTTALAGSEFEGLSQSQINNMLKEERAWAELLKQKYGDTDWLVRYVTDTTTGTKKPYFYSKSNLGAAIYDDKTKASLSAINCYTIGSEQKISEFKGVENCKVEKDSSGRLISLAIPKYNDDGTVTYIEYTLTTETSTDQAAYNDAMNQYEYDKYLYDQAVENINSKIEIIQAEDKNLELRLKQLDTEQKAIQTEKEAVSKVIEKNTQDTFKTFSA